MNIGLSVDPTIPETTRRELETLQSAIQSGWLVEHELDGTHVAPVEYQFTQAMAQTNLSPIGITIDPQYPDSLALKRYRGGCLWLQLRVRGCTVVDAPLEIYFTLPDGWVCVDRAMLAIGQSVNSNESLITVWSNRDKSYISMAQIGGGPWVNVPGTTELCFTTGDFRVKRG